MTLSLLIRRQARAMPTRMFMGKGNVPERPFSNILESSGHTTAAEPFHKTINESMQSLTKVFVYRIVEVPKDL